MFAIVNQRGDARGQQKARKPADRGVRREDDAGDLLGHRLEGVPGGKHPLFAGDRIQHRIIDFYVSSRHP